MGPIYETGRRNKYIGMGSFLLQRITGIALVLYLIPHVFVISSFRMGGTAGFDRMAANVQWPEHAGMAANLIMRVAPFFDVLLLAAIVFHALNGVRIIVVDIGRGCRAEKAWFYAAMAAAAVILAASSWAILSHTVLAH